MGGLDDLYQELILDHYRRKRGEGRLDDPTVAVDQNNPLCGDEIHVELGIEDGRIARLAHTGEGCSISQASASMMYEALNGRSVEEALAEVEGITIYGPRDPARRGAAVSFSLPDLHPHDIAQLVDQEGVCVRAGHHCAKPLMRVLGVGATARASAYLYNSPDEIDVLVRALHSARRAFGGR